MRIVDLYYLLNYNTAERLWRLKNENGVSCALYFFTDVACGNLSERFARSADTPTVFQVGENSFKQLSVSTPLEGANK